MKKLIFTGVLTLALGSFSFAQTESNTSNQEPTRKHAAQPQKVATVKEVELNKPTEEVKPVENQHSAPVRKREALRPAPKAVYNIKPVEKTEKTVE